MSFSSCLVEVDVVVVGVVEGMLGDVGVWAVVWRAVRGGASVD